MLAISIILTCRIRFNKPVRICSNCCRCNSRIQIYTLADVNGSLTARHRSFNLIRFLIVNPVCVEGYTFCRSELLRPIVKRIDISFALGLTILCCVPSLKKLVAISSYSLGIVRNDDRLTGICLCAEYCGLTHINCRILGSVIILIEVTAVGVEYYRVGIPVGGIKIIHLLRIAQIAIVSSPVILDLLIFCRVWLCECRIIIPSHESSGIIVNLGKRCTLPVGRTIRIRVFIGLIVLRSLPKITFT